MSFLGTTYTRGIISREVVVRLPPFFLYVTFEWWSMSRANKKLRSLFLISRTCVFSCMYLHVRTISETRQTDHIFGEGGG